MNLTEALGLIKEDLAKHRMLIDGSLFKLYYMERGFRYCVWMRLSSVSGVIGIFSKFILHHLQSKFGIQIHSSSKIGGGFYIGHGVGIVIHPRTIIGKNVNVSQFLTIGSNHNTPAVIGDNVYIGPGVCIVVDVHIGNNVTIGAGSVVTHDVPDYAVVVGVPAKVIRIKEHK